MVSTWGFSHLEVMVRLQEELRMHIRKSERWYEIAINAGLCAGCVTHLRTGPRVSLLHIVHGDVFVQLIDGCNTINLSSNDLHLRDCVLAVFSFGAQATLREAHQVHKVAQSRHWKFGDRLLDLISFGGLCKFA